MSDKGEDLLLEDVGVVDEMRQRLELLRIEQLDRNPRLHESATIPLASTRRLTAPLTPNPLIALNSRSPNFCLISCAGFPSNVTMNAPVSLSFSSDARTMPRLPKLPAATSSMISVAGRRPSSASEVGTRMLEAWIDGVTWIGIVGVGREVEGGGVTIAGGVGAGAGVSSSEEEARTSSASATLVRRCSGLNKQRARSFFGSCTRLSANFKGKRTKERTPAMRATISSAWVGSILRTAARRRSCSDAAGLGEELGEDAVGERGAAKPNWEGSGERCCEASDEWEKCRTRLAEEGWGENSEVCKNRWSQSRRLRRERKSSPRPPSTAPRIPSSEIGRAHV